MTKDQYIKAKKLIANPKKWNQGHYSVNKHGKRCLALADEAIKRCALIACNRYADPCDHSRKELGFAAKALGFLNIVHLNDKGTHTDVMKMFDLAIGYCDDGSAVLA